MIEKILFAQKFAHEAHDSIGQVRKYNGKPYWVHTDEVADTVKESFGNESLNSFQIDMICAAHLHDVLEDVAPKNPKYDKSKILYVFGHTVSLLVDELTDKFTKEAFPDWNRAKRHAHERERLGGISIFSKTIKLADLLSNTASIVKEDPKFAVIYIKEKIETLPYLVGGDNNLLKRAQKQVEEANKTLKIC